MTTVTFQNVPPDILNNFLNEVSKNKCGYCRKQEKKIQQEWVGHPNPQKLTELIHLVHRKCFVPSFAGQPRCPTCAVNAKIDFTFGERFRFFRECFANCMMEHNVVITLTEVINSFSLVLVASKIGTYFGPMLCHQFPKIFDYSNVEPDLYMQVAVSIIGIALILFRNRFIPEVRGRGFTYLDFQFFTLPMTWFSLILRGFHSISPEMNMGFICAYSSKILLFRPINYVSHICVPRTMSFLAQKIRGRI